MCSSLLPWGRNQQFLVIIGAQFFQTELKPVRRVSAVANLKKFKHNFFKYYRKPTLNMGDFRVAQPITNKVEGGLAIRRDMGVGQFY